MPGVLIKRGNVDTGMNAGRTLCEDEGRGQSDASTSEGMLKTVSKLLEAMVRYRFFLTALTRGSWHRGKKVSLVRAALAVGDTT